MSSTRRRTRSPESDDLYSELQGAAEDVGDFVGERLRDRPYASLATAAAIGYALGLRRGSLVLLTRLGAALVMGRFESLLGEIPSRRSASARRRRPQSVRT